MHATTLHLLPLLLATSRMEPIRGFRGFAPPSAGVVAFVNTSSERGGASAGAINPDDDDCDDDVGGGDMRTKTTTMTTTRRRSFLSMAAGYGTAVASKTVRGVGALPFFGDARNDRRQLELCLATVLRTEYWATNVARSLRTRLLLPSRTAPSSPIDDPRSATTIVESDNQRRQPYLEARLGAKALLTQKIGGGANARVIALGGYQLRGCLDDVAYWCATEGRRTDRRRTCSNELAAASEELVESLASVVEFDGLETTIDPSPRSSLMLGMYTDEKATFVYRTLVERVVPSCERVLGVFGNERRRTIEGYVIRDYPNEVPTEVLEILYGEQQNEGGQ
ncbi:hypothetical protein ACHAXA_010470 [Cyclostephanos tholiformis]|uniref:Uncharacterized protein n=1 Tax=Cyclostephanos tholiformis TaxID=382380 RepID=A0ABD3SFS1_9STRA